MEYHENVGWALFIVGLVAAAEAALIGTLPLWVAPPSVVASVVGFVVLRRLPPNA